MAEKQTFENHFRWFPLFHFVVMPMLLVFLIYTIVQMVRFPGVDRAMLIFLAITLVLIHLCARIQALTVQDRVIRLEEQLRFREVLPKNLAAKAMKLKTSQLIALRFASDEELPSLVERTLNGDLETPKDIKLAVKDWRGDCLRA